MKKMLFLAMICPFLGFSQINNLDNFNSQILKTNPDVQEINLALEKGHNRAVMGTLLSAAGLLFISMDKFVWSKDRDGNGKPYKNNSVYTGLGLITIGTTLQISSHRLLKRAKSKLNKLNLTR